MNHSPSKVKVFQSDDYKLFRMVEGNRKINEIKVARIIKEIESGNDVLNESPILVAENKNHLEIKDGQHRFVVAQKLGRPVHYILKKEAMSIYNVARVNSNTEKWKSVDFINAYSKAGDENYIKLGKFYKKYGIAIGTCLSLLTHGVQKSDGSDESLTQQFQEGRFVIKKWSEAVQLAEICKNFEQFPGWNGRGFVLAISKIVQAGLCEMDKLVAKFNKDPRKLMPQPNAKGYLNNLQIIYNYDNSKQRPIY